MKREAGLRVAPSLWGSRGQRVIARSSTGPFAGAVRGRQRVQPSNFGIGADPGHPEHRRPSTSVPTEAKLPQRKISCRSHPGLLIQACAAKTF